MRIGASLNGFERRLLNLAAGANAAAAVNALHLATGKKVNTPADDPSAFLQINGLESRLSNINTTLSQIQTAANVVAQVQLTLDLIDTELTIIRNALLADEDLSLTQSQRDANQATIDQALAQINQLATSDIEGRRRLDGSGDYQYSGGRTDRITELRVYTARESSITVNVITVATQAELTYTGSSGQITADATFTLAGDRGSVVFSVSQNDLLTDVVDDINQQSHKTGIVAKVSGDSLELSTVDFGSRATLDVTVSSGTFSVTGGNGNGSDKGVDAVAIINDRTITGDGNRFTYSANGTHLVVEVDAYFIGQMGKINITGDRVAQFAISTDPRHVGKLGLAGVQTAQFRGLSGSLNELASGRSLSGLNTNTSQALRVVDDAIARLKLIDGRLQGFSDSTIDSSEALLNGFATTVSDAIININSADLNEEALLLTKNQDLAKNAIASLSLLDDQRALVVSLLQQLAAKY